VNALATEWRVIATFPDYAVSEGGDVQRIRRGLRNHRLSGRPLKPCKSPGKDYPHVTLCRDGRKFSVRINRLVCEVFNGPAPTPIHHAAHGDGDPDNNHYSNLRWAAPVENEADKVVHGTVAAGDRHGSITQPHRRARGARHGLAKLTPSDVQRIRADTRHQRAIAADLGVSQRTVWGVKNGKTWGHIL